MSLAKLSDEAIEQRLRLVEGAIHRCRDTKSLPTLNNLFQRLIEEQVRRDLLRSGEKQT